MKNNKRIKLSKSDLKNIITESINNIIEQKKNNEILYESVKRTVSEVLNEISYDTAKNAYIKAADRAYASRPINRKESDRQKKQLDNIYQHMSDKSRDIIDYDMPVVVVGGDKQGRYTVRDIFKNFEVVGYAEPPMNTSFLDSKVIGYPVIADYYGPMWDGNKIRYETHEVYDLLSV